MTSLTLGNVFGIIASHAQVLPQRKSAYQEKAREAKHAAVELEALTDLVMWWGPAIARALIRNRSSVSNAFKFGLERRSDEAYRMELQDLLDERFRVRRFSPSSPAALFVGDFLEVSWNHPQ